jgi:hypothetical protein
MLIRKFRMEQPRDILVLVIVSPEWLRKKELVLYIEET